MPSTNGKGQAEFNSIPESDSGGNLSNPNPLTISHTDPSAKGERRERVERELVVCLRTQKKTFAGKFEIAAKVMIAAISRDKIIDTRT